MAAAMQCEGSNYADNSEVLSEAATRPIGMEVRMPQPVWRQPELRAQQSLESLRRHELGHPAQRKTHNGNRPGRSMGCLTRIPRLRRGRAAELLLPPTPET